MKEDLPVSRGASVVGEGAREAAIARLCNLFATGGISLEGLSETMEGVLAASSHHELAGAMSGLGWPVALTPPAHRLPAPLVVRVPDADLALGPGWQLAADTSVCTGWGRARLDLTSASWDAPQINLRLETWGSLDVVVPRGVAIQVCGATATVRLEALSPPLHGGPSAPPA